MTKAETSNDQECHICGYIQDYTQDECSCEREWEAGENEVLHYFIDPGGCGCGAELGFTWTGGLEMGFMCLRAEKIVALIEPV